MTDPYKLGPFEPAHIKIPVIVGHNQHIGFHQLSLPSPKTVEQFFIR